AAAALAYAGTVLIEGTALSEGRGTARPFTLIGAPDLDAAGLVDALRRRRWPGLLVRPVAFTPAASKHAGRVCRGVELFVVDRAAFRALPAVLDILAFIRDRQPELLAPNRFMDRLAGGPALRRWCGTPGAPPAALLEAWRSDQARFRERAAPHLLYGGPL